MQLRFFRLAALIALASPLAMALEEPDFEVLQRSDDYEVRRYAPYIVAEVDVSGGHTEAGNKAFRILANYIFGDNQAQQFSQEPAFVPNGPRRSVKMAMTAPVTSTPVYGGQWRTVAFIMEKQYSLDSLPEPNDDRIRLRDEPARVMAVSRYSGRWSDRVFADREAALLQALERDGITPLGYPLLARYDAPFKPWFLRRNESMVEIDWPERTSRLD